MGNAHTVTVDAKDRLTIPRELREELGIEPGDTLFVEREENGRVLRYAKTENPFSSRKAATPASSASARSAEATRSMTSDTSGSTTARRCRTLALPYLLEGYGQVTPLPPDHERRISFSSLLIGIRWLARMIERFPERYFRNHQAVTSIRRGLATLDS